MRYVRDLQSKEVHEFLDPNWSCAGIHAKDEAKWGTFLGLSRAESKLMKQLAPSSFSSCMSLSLVSKVHHTATMQNVEIDVISNAALKKHMQDLADMHDVELYGFLRDRAGSRPTMPKHIMGDQVGMLNEASKQNKINEQLTEWMDAKTSKIYGASIDGKYVGCLTTLLASDDAIKDDWDAKKPPVEANMRMLHLLVVNPEFRNSGIAAELVERATGDAYKNKESVGCHAWCNIGVLRFWRKMGFGLMNISKGDEKLTKMIGMIHAAQAAFANGLARQMVFDPHLHGSMNGDGPFVGYPSFLDSTVTIVKIREKKTKKDVDFDAAMKAYPAAEGIHEKTTPSDLERLWGIVKDRYDLYIKIHSVNKEFKYDETMKDKVRANDTAVHFSKRPWEGLMYGIHDASDIDEAYDLIRTCLNENKMNETLFAVRILPEILDAKSYNNLGSILRGEDILDSSPSDVSSEERHPLRVPTRILTMKRAPNPKKSVRCRSIRLENSSNVCASGVRNRHPVTTRSVNTSWRRTRTSRTRNRMCLRKGRRPSTPTSRTRNKRRCPPTHHSTMPMSRKRNKRRCLRKGRWPTTPTSRKRNKRRCPPTHHSTMPTSRKKRRCRRRKRTRKDEKEPESGTDEDDDDDDEEG